MRRLLGHRSGASRVRRAFSVVELLIALTISSMLLTACLVALDGTFKSYERTTESASTHVVTRLVMTRMLSMIRQGEQFAPFPEDVFSQPRVSRDWIEFVSYRDPSDPTRTQVTRIARVADPDRAGRFILGYTLTPMVNGFAQPPLFSNRPLIRNVRDATFTLEFDVGPRLLRATIDLTVFPDDVENNQAAIATGMDGKVLRLLASTSPRRLDQ